MSTGFQSFLPVALCFCTRHVFWVPSQPHFPFSNKKLHTPYIFELRIQIFHVIIIACATFSMTECTGRPYTDKLDIECVSVGLLTFV